uniref:Uncharacterized protein n=1 Tax=Mytilus trossulus TaxID=6551 RepID=A0A077H3M1_MYTTR
MSMPRLPLLSVHCHLILLFFHQFSLFLLDLFPLNLLLQIFFQMYFPLFFLFLLKHSDLYFCHFLEILLFLSLQCFQPRLSLLSQFLVSLQPLLLLLSLWFRPQWSQQRFPFLRAFLYLLIDVLTKN